MAIKIYCSFRQTTHGGKSIFKEIELSAIPYPGVYFEYADGWGLERVVSSESKGLHLEIGVKSISISGYGPQFDPEEIAQLEALGWTLG